MINILEKKVKKYIDVENLPQPPIKILVALSGGADSVSLLFVMKNLGYQITAVHCNFHLRGEESNRDKNFVENLCKRIGVKLKIKDFETEEYAKKNRISIEMAARKLRYKWFDDEMIDENAEYIAVAHHSDDLIETFLMNMIRGSGIRGLSGIKSLNGKIMRPLLCVWRKEIEFYLKELDESYVIDSTNTDEKILRNKFRHSVIPFLENINNSAKENIIKDINNLHSVENIYNQSIYQLRNNLIKENGETKYIDICELNKYKEKETILFELLKEYGFNSPTIKEIALSINNPKSGKRFISYEYEILIDRKVLILSRKENRDLKTYIINKGDNFIKSPIPIDIDVKSVNNIEIKKNNDFGYTDYDKLKFPLTIRLWKNGDWFVPFGMIYKKKISDYLIDRKKSLIEKNNTYIITDKNGEIIWIIGERISNKFKIDENTKKCLIFKKKY